MNVNVIARGDPQGSLASCVDGIHIAAVPLARTDGEVEPVSPGR
jgi:hypothetical protein